MILINLFYIGLQLQYIIINSKSDTVLICIYAQRIIAHTNSNLDIDNVWVYTKLHLQK